MTSQAQELCEDFTGLPCDDVEFELSASFSDDFEPAALGIPLVLVYLDPDTGDWAHHIFSDSINKLELGTILNGKPTQPVVNKLVEGGSMLFHDPEDDFVVVSGVEWTAQGLVQSQQE